MEIAFGWKNFVNKEAFLAEVEKTADQLGINPDWLMMVFYLESGFKRKAVNKLSKATGLIQWLPSTAKALGTSTRQILNMTGVQQVQLAYRYFEPYAGRMNSFYDCYFAVFSPKGIGKPDSHILYHNDSNGYKWNVVLDTKYGNNNKRLEVIDIKRYIYTRVKLATQAKDWPAGFKFYFEK
jgi:hypothetical protein